jgi:hypothetical protein
MTIRRHLTRIGNYLVSNHAVQRMNSRHIRHDELICSYEDPELLFRHSYGDRTVYKNPVYNLYIVVDNPTGIIVTVIPTERRRKNQNKRFHHNSINSPDLIHLDSICRFLSHTPNVYPLEHI